MGNSSFIYLAPVVAVRDVLALLLAVEEVCCGEVEDVDDVVLGGLAGLASGEAVVRVTRVWLRK